jgi:hypothetical protein
MRCFGDGMRGLKHSRECGYRVDLDMETLVCTGGRDFPLARIAEQLRCPRCGCRRVAVMFGPPNGYELVAARSTWGEIGLSRQEAPYSPHDAQSGFEQPP